MDHTGPPIISGLSPSEGMPGTTLTIRGENLGTDPTDIVALVICGTDCLLTLKWKSPSKITARVGNARRGLGDIIVVTKSGGRAVSNVQFRVLIEQVGPLQESTVWVDESRTVPCRSVIRNVAEVTEMTDALGLNKKSAAESSKMSYNDLAKLFPDASGNLRMGNFNPAWYLLENHKNASFSDLLKGIDNLKKEIAKERQISNDVHRDNLYPIINCIDSLNNLQNLIEKDAKDHSWPLTDAAKKLVDTANQTADNLFSDVLGRKDRADSTRNALSVLTRFKFIFFLTKSIDENLQQGDYATILNDYTRAKALYNESDVALFKEVMNVLEMKISNFKDILKEKLVSSPLSFEEQSRLIKYLKILDPDSNPAWDCITAYHCWLENVLWELQDRYCKLANEEVNDQLEFSNLETGSNYIQTFITEILGILTEKLPAFWKLAQNYSDASDEKYLAQQDDINQMLANTINVTSWIMLNALIPSALPDTVTQQYKSEFAVWPTINQRDKDKNVQLNQLLQALKSLRATIKSLLESQFSRLNISPLTELSKTLRLRCIDLLMQSSIERILALTNQENWNVEIDVRTPKTTVPDLFETQLNDVLPLINQILSTSAYPGEEDLFSKDSIRQLIVDRLILMVCSIRDGYEQILQLKFKRRPNRLNLLLDTSDIASNTSSNEDNLERSRSSELVTRRLLICICNFDYIVHHSLPLICKRLAETVKYANLILEKSKQEFLSFRQELVNKYLNIRSGPLIALIESVNYTHLPESDDVSSFIKELIMGIIFIKAELYLLLPQLSDAILKSAIENIVQKFLQFVADVNISNGDIATQMAIDITGVEEALHSFLSKQQRGNINSIRAQLIKRMDRTIFDHSIHAFHDSMRFALESLDSGEKIEQDEMDSSDV